jgi:hypothetical protein
MAQAMFSEYQLAFFRIRAEYLEMPGMRLTAEQVMRLCGVDVAVCRTVLDDLVRARFLRRGPDATYVRSGTPTTESVRSEAPPPPRC